MSVNYQSPMLNRSQATDNRAEAGRPLVVLVDDDDTLREALHELMLSVGLDTISFSSTRDLLEAELPDRPCCIVADVRMPIASGLDLQRRLAESGDAKSIVFLTAHGDIPMSVQAIKAGAVDFLTKPVRDQTLLDAIAAGIERDIKQRARSRVLKEHLSKLALLTPRERQVLREVAVGRRTSRSLSTSASPRSPSSFTAATSCARCSLLPSGNSFASGRHCLPKCWRGWTPSLLGRRLWSYGASCGALLPRRGSLPMAASRRRVGGERGTGRPAEAPTDDHGEAPRGGRDCDAGQGEAAIAGSRDHDPGEQGAGGEADQVRRSRRGGPTPTAIERSGEAEHVGH
jgi:FixJ family two-component response regulator